MASELYQEKASSKQLYLDPRTKILLCLSVSTTLIAGNGTGLATAVLDGFKLAKGEYINRG